MTSTNPNDDKPLMAIPNANDGETIARTILERAPVLVYVVDLSFKVVLMNRELREISGWDTSKCRDVESLLGNFYPDTQYCAPIREIHEGWGKTPSEHVRDTVMVLTTTDGRQRSISWTTARLRVGRGPVRGYIAIGVDVTTRRNLEHWVTLFQQSLLQMREALALTDPDGGVLAWSAGATQLLGHREDDIQGRSLHSVFQHAEGETENAPLSDALRSDSSDPFPADLLSDSGEVCRLDLEVKKIASPSGDALAYLVQMAEESSGKPMVSSEDLEAALGQVKESQELASAAQEESDRLRLQLEESTEGAKHAEEELAAAHARAADHAKEVEAAEASLGEAKDHSAALQDTLNELEKERAGLLSEIEETKAGWEEKREALVKKHVAELDTLIESSANERTELLESVEARRLEQGEQHRSDILAAEERAEELREVLQEKHDRARLEWDDAIAIAVHEATEKKTLLEDQICRLLQDHHSPDGGLSAAGVSALAALIGAAPPKASPTLPAVEAAEEVGGPDDEDDLQLDEEVDQAIDAPPPVSPAMVATASELEVHQPAEMDSELELESADDLHPHLDIEPLPGSDTLALDSEPLSGADDLELDDIQENDLSEDDLSEDDLSEDNLSEDDLSEDDLSEDDLDFDDDPEEDDLDLEIDEEDSESGLEREPTEEGKSSTKNPESDEPVGSSD